MAKTSTATRGIWRSTKYMCNITRQMLFYRLVALTGERACHRTTHKSNAYITGMGRSNA